MNTRKKILICPLDWGLGHATRCMPLIRYFLEEGHKVLVAGNKQTHTLVRSEFEQVELLPLPGYEIRYAGNGKKLPWVMARQIPRILLRIRAERNWLKHIVNVHRPDLLISDNRYGLSVKIMPCVFITHQLQIRVPQSNFLQKIVNQINHYYLKQFSSVWIPDYADHTMAGELSKPFRSLPRIDYLGNLSRFSSINKKTIRYEKMFVLSGPEPQRSLFENIILSQIAQTNERILLVRGKPGAAPMPQSNPNIEIVSYLPGEVLQEAIQSAGLIICRSGYSSIMDLIKLGKHALLVPTPGQTEQEYLAQYLTEKKWFMSCRQEQFDLAKLSALIEQFGFADFPELDLQQYKSVLARQLQEMSPEL